MRATQYSENLSFLGLVQAPASIRSIDDLKSWGTDHREALRRALSQFGALLLRGFPMVEPPDFGAFFATQETGPMPYVGGFTTRQQVHEGVYTSTSAPSMVSIPLHNEMAYSETYPHRVYLFCAQPSKSGGQTPLADGRKVLARVARDLVARLRERGVTYIRNLPPEKGRLWPPSGWRKAFSSTDKAAAEKAARESGNNVEWFDDIMRITYRGPLTRIHPVTGEEVWFSQLHNFHHSNSLELWHVGNKVGWAIFRCIEASERMRLPPDRLSVAVLDGKGTPITREEALDVRRAIWRETRTFEWQRGDVLITDNLLVLHGRKPFKGERRVYAALARDE